MRKELGKITRIEFGLGGYQDAMLGLTLVFGGDAWGTSTFLGTWGPSIKCSETAKWTEADRSRTNDETVRKIGEMLKEAKKSYISELKGVPVEVVFDGNMMTDWRILKEVL